MVDKEQCFAPDCIGVYVGQEAGLNFLPCSGVDKGINGAGDQGCLLNC